MRVPNKDVMLSAIDGMKLQGRAKLRFRAATIRVCSQMEVLQMAGTNQNRHLIPDLF
jgi:hypothetical protein